MILAAKPQTFKVKRNNIPEPVTPRKQLSCDH